VRTSSTRDCGAPPWIQPSGVTGEFRGRTGAAARRSAFPRAWRRSGVESRFGGRAPGDDDGPAARPEEGRSRAIVGAIVEAGRRIVEGEGAEALTTNRIAERAGISIGSLYRHFPNKEAILGAICGDETERTLLDLRRAERRPIDELPLEEALAAIVDFQIERHRRLLRLGRDYYRANHEQFSLARRMEADAVIAPVRALLVHCTASVRVRDVDAAAFLIARGISSLVRRALEERPEALLEPSLRQELVDLAVCYATADRR